MENNQILFRTAGGKAKQKELGLGHIYRTINLAKKFPKKNVFFLIEDYGGVKQILHKNGFKKNIFSIKTNPKSLDDISKTKYIVEKHQIGKIVIDTYNISRTYLKSIKKIAKLILIRDLYSTEFAADLLVNGFVGFKSKKCFNEFKTMCLLGPKYQILNNNFSLEHIAKQKKFDILASFGGFDEKNICGVFTDSIEQYVPRLKIKIILGPLSSTPNNLKKLKKKYPSRIIILRQAKNMAKEIENAKFGFCAGGITTYEFASKGVPFAIICDEKHQLDTAHQWEKLKIAKNLGLINSHTPEKIKSVLEEFLDNKTKLKKNSKIVDGLGAQRVTNEILKI